MNAYAKIIATTLPLALFFFFSAVATTYYFAHQSLTELAERWLATRLTEAIAKISEQEAILHVYGLEDIPASITMAQMDASAAMQDIDMGTGGYLFAVDTHGFVVMHPDGRNIGRDVSDQDWFQRLQRDKGRFTYPTGNENFMAMFDRFKPWDWYVIAAAPEGELYGAVDRMRPYILYLGISGAGILAFVLMLMTRRLTDPLRLLADGANRIGQGDLETRITVQSRDEFARLADVFNRMTANLQETLNTLQRREENFRALIENASDIVTVLDDAGLAAFHDGDTGVRRTEVNSDNLAHIL